MNIIELAKKAGLLGEGEEWVSPHKEHMEHFFALVRAEALEEAAELGDSLDPLQDGAIAATIRGLARICYTDTKRF